jgi:hypothetical protein
MESLSGRIVASITQKIINKGGRGAGNIVMLPVEHHLNAGLPIDAGPL